MLLGLRRLEKMIFLGLGEFHGPQGWSSLLLFLAGPRPCVLPWCVGPQRNRLAVVRPPSSSLAGVKSAADKVCGVTAVGCV